jgi:hypothetical protein
MNEACATENYKNMKAIGDNDREVTIFYLTDELILRSAMELASKFTEDKYYTPCPPSLPETATSAIGKLSVVP